MRFIFTGTGTSQGIPVIACECEVCKSTDQRDKRLRTAALIQSEQTSIAIDAGPDFRQQMLRHQVDRLDAVLFTHQHKDHTAGLDDIRAFNFRQRRAMQIYANAATIEHLKREYYYIFENTGYPGIPLLEFNLISEAPFFINEIEFRPIPVMHAEMEVYGYRINNFAYITDANYISEASYQKLQGVETLVLNALRQKHHHSHFSLNEAVEIAQSLKCKQAYFTHISHMMGSHEATSSLLPPHIQIAVDGLELLI